MKMTQLPMKRRLMAAAVLLGGFALAACGTSGPGVQARQTNETTTTSAPEPTTTTAEPTPTTPGPTIPPATAAAVEPPCTSEALAAAYTVKLGSLAEVALKVQKCVDGWATSSQTKGFDPPTFTLYRADGDHWVAVNRSAGKLCVGYGVPPEVARQIGCDT
jgi:hypothetical protein